MKFLKEHIEHAWINMMNNYNVIMDGVTDLTARKEFVSSLQNVIELIFKQYMIDRNDHEVLVWSPDPKKKKTFLQTILFRKIETRRTEQIFFDNSTDINAYFIADPSRACVKSIGFDALIKKIGKMIRERNPKFTNSNLKLLKELRNNETHFYIDDSYLSFAEFKELRKLIKDVYDYIEIDAFLGFFGTPFKHDKDSLKFFDYSSFTANSFADLVKNSKTNQEILNELGDYKSTAPHGIAIDYCDPNDIYGISYHLYQLNQIDDAIDIRTKITQLELYRRLELMNKNNMIKICDDGYLNCDSNGHPNPQLTFVSKS